MSSAARKIDTAPFSLAPLTPTIGAEIGGIDLARPLDVAALAALRRALLDWKVLFFRDQDITTEQHLAFARQFGELEVHPFAPHKEGYPEVLAISHGPGNRGPRERLAQRRDLAAGAVARLGAAGAGGAGGRRRYAVRRHVCRL